jgi:hypothetical protein
MERLGVRVLAAPRRSLFRYSGGFLGLISDLAGFGLRVRRWLSQEPFPQACPCSPASFDWE